MTWAAPQATLLPDGKRLHLHHGPIDLIIGVSGDQRAACFAKATSRFQTVLEGLAQELDMLRRPLPTVCQDPVGRRMVEAVSPFADVFVTPMAAVAGAVADAVLAAMVDGQTPRKVYVNNGGDIAFALHDGQTFEVQSRAGKVTINARDLSRGIATSGWQGRSHSFGIADAVTVLADTAAAADVAATLISNAVDLPGHPAVRRQPAEHLSPDSDLGARLVTTDVAPLSASEITAALAAGFTYASGLQTKGLIHGAALCLQGQSQILSHTTGVPAYA